MVERYLKQEKWENIGKHNSISGTEWKGNSKKL